MIRLLKGRKNPDGIQGDVARSSEEGVSFFRKLACNRIVNIEYYQYLIDSES